MPNPDAAPMAASLPVNEHADGAAVGAVTPSAAFWLGDWLAPDEGLRLAAIRWYRSRVRMMMIEKAIIRRRMRARSRHRLIDSANLRAASRRDGSARLN